MTDALTPPKESAERSEPAGWFRRLTLYSVSSAVCAVIPIPFLDDHLLRRTRRRMVREIATEHGLTLDPTWLHHLSGTEGKSALGCFIGTLFGLFFKLVYKLVRRVFRSLMFFLAIKDGADAASRTFHEGYLLRAALPELKQRLGVLKERGELEATTDDDGIPWEIRGVRSAVEASCREVDTRPFESTIKGVLRGSRTLLRRTARIFAREARENEASDPAAEPAPETSQRLAPDLVDAMVGALSRQDVYLRSLEAHFMGRWSPESASADPTVTLADRNSSATDSGSQT